MPWIRDGRGCPRNRLTTVYTDFGYNYDSYRSIPHKRGIRLAVVRRDVAHGVAVSQREQAAWLDFRHVRPGDPEIWVAWF